VFGAGGTVGLGLLLSTWGVWQAQTWLWGLGILAVPVLLGIALMVTSAATSFVVLDHAVHVHVSLATAGPAYVVEGIGIGAALSAAREQSHGNWWRTFATRLVSCVLVQLIGFVSWLIGGVGLLVLQRVSTRPRPGPPDR
jgi:hypothetical protein